MLIQLCKAVTVREDAKQRKGGGEGQVRSELTRRRTTENKLSPGVHFVHPTSKLVAYIMSSDTNMVVLFPNALSVFYMLDNFLTFPFFCISFKGHVMNLLLILTFTPEPLDHVPQRWKKNIYLLTWLRVRIPC